MNRTLLALAIVVPFLDLNASDTPLGVDPGRGQFEARLVTFRSEDTAELKAQLLNTKWSWIHPGSEITFREGGQAWVNTDKEVKNWFVADAAGRVVAGTFAGSRTFMFTFSPDLKTARAVLDGDRVWESRRMK